jgi:hypothetical protein
MLLLAGAGLSVTGALVTYGALTGRLAAMLAAVFRPRDLASGYYVAPGATDVLNTVNIPAGTKPQTAGGTTTSVPDFLGSLIPGYNSTPAAELPRAGGL